MPITCPPRRREPEWMDQPGLDEGLHLSALDGLRRINRWSRTAEALWSTVRRFVAADSNRHWRILDVACGGGDVAVGVARRARSSGFRVTVDGCDVSRVAVVHSTAHAAAHQLTDATFFEHDALGDQLPEGYDVVMCSLFLHHLDDDEAVALLRRMAAATRRIVVVSDLRRSLSGNVLAWLACHLLSRSPVVHDDGPRSAHAAFTLAEARDLALRSGLDNASLRRCWPQRFLLCWEHQDQR